MKNKSLLLFAVALFPIVAFAETPETNKTVGRYQVTFGVEGLYFLDTATGALWLKKEQRDWQPVDSPVNRTSKQKKPTDRPVTLSLPQGGESMPMVQRESRKIPGSSETLSVQLGDITAGQVFVEVIDINGKVWVKRTSVKNNEFLKFKFEGRDIYLQVTDMVNNFVGDDICQIQISYEKPNRQENKAKRKQAAEE